MKHKKHHLTHAEEVKGGKDSHHMMHDHHGHIHHHLAAEHKRHGDRLHHEHAMHEMHHHMSANHAPSGHSSHGIYKHEEDRPAQPAQGHMMQDMGCSDYKGEADPIAYGQSEGSNAREDAHRIVSQFKHYHWS